MSSGLVFVAIVVIWAVILVPRVVRLYERSATHRTSARFRSAMDALGRAKATNAGVRTVYISRGSSTSSGQKRASDYPSRPSEVARRRRRTFAVLATIATAGLLATASGPVHWAVALAATLPLLTFAGACVMVPLRESAVVDHHVAPNPVADEDLLNNKVAVEVQVPSARRYVPSSPPHMVLLIPDQAFRPGELVAFRNGQHQNAASSRGSLVGARTVNYDSAQEQRSAIAATYASAEEYLGLDTYLASPAERDNLPYRRAASE